VKDKVLLRLHRGQKAHPGFGFPVVEGFVDDLSAHGRPDPPLQLMGHSIRLMLSPLPRDPRGSQARTVPTASQAQPPVGRDRLPECRL
jgi:hypothetical protein